MSEVSYAGIDWGDKRHALCLVDGHGEVLLDGSYDHTEAEVQALIAAIQDRGGCRVTIERTDGIIVDRLLEADFTVLPVPPIAMKDTRRRYSAAGRKSDSFDAFCLAELARTDAHRFPALRPDSDETKTLRALVRVREDLVADKVALTHQVRAQLDYFWPGATRVVAELDSPIGLAFLKRFPSPGDASDLDEEGLTALRREVGSRVKSSSTELLERMRSAPRSVMGAAETRARRTAVLSLVTLLDRMVGEIKELTSLIHETLSAHPDGKIFVPLFGAKAITPALLITGFGDDRARYPRADVLAAKAGVSPVAKQSGQLHVAAFRHVCDKRLRNAVGALANTSRYKNGWAQAIYASARERGHRHPHAIRILGRAWVRVLWRCWQDGVPYDPSKHGARRRLELADRELAPELAPASAAWRARKEAEGS